jgi:secreted Zn-dependent insulinase-like peptidase
MVEPTLFAQSKKDKNDYRNFTLENGLEVLMVTDNNSKDTEADSAIASVSLCVNVGCYNEPEDREGLSHFLEHMIFMGSSKYPDENLYSQMIS